MVLISIEPCTKRTKKRFQSPKTVQLFDRYATYNGSDPYQTPATLNIIPHLEFGIGAYFPNEGMYSITDSLYELAKRQGVSFQFNTRVQKIVVEEGVVKGIENESGLQRADFCSQQYGCFGNLSKTIKRTQKTQKRY